MTSPSQVVRPAPSVRTSMPARPGEALTEGEFGWINYDVMFYPPLIDSSSGG